MSPSEATCYSWKKNCGGLGVSDKAYGQHEAILRQRLRGMDFVADNLFDGR